MSRFMELGQSDRKLVSGFVSLYSRSSRLTCGKQSLGLLPDVLNHPFAFRTGKQLKINVL